MGRHIIKVAPDLDLYVEWSSIVDSPVCWGTRAEMLEEGTDAVRLDRADKFGTSSLPGFDNWETDSLIYEQQGLLPRTKIPEALRRFENDEDADITDLLIPFEED